MTPRSGLVTTTVLTLAFAQGVLANTPVVQRVALIVGANRGAADRVALRYAVMDAERMATVLRQMGGVPIQNCVVIREPTRAALLDGLAEVGSLVAEGHRQAQRTELVFYYSGHADEAGLMLGQETFSYRDLRDAIRGVGSDVGITVLDACASGAITRLKGGQSHPAFLSDASTQMKGYAFLTSSSENEVAQESERLKGSFFTHALLSGLRGAADVTGDGRVTLNEAYQFAFHETLAQTATTQGGAQHPAYDIRMAGTGDVVITDVRKTSCTLVLEEDMDGRVFVQNVRRQLVAELSKPAGRAVELGLEPGRYDVFYEQEPVLLAGRVMLGEGQRHTLRRTAMAPTTRVPTRRRGPGADSPEAVVPARRGSRLALDGRTRAEFWGGMARPFVRVDGQGTQDSVEEVRGGQGGFALAHWVREDTAVEIAFAATELDVISNQSVDTSEVVDAKGTFNLLFGARYYFPSATFGAPFRPYVSGAVGPYMRFLQTGDDVNGTFETQDTGLGAHIGLGGDLMLARHFALTIRSGSYLRSGLKAQWGFGFGAAFQWGSRSE